jgi:hypothetical protein
LKDERELVLSTIEQHRALLSLLPDVPTSAVSRQLIEELKTWLHKLDDRK